jgi:hypothetical protein
MQSSRRDSLSDIWAAGHDNLVTLRGKRSRQWEQRAEMPRLGDTDNEDSHGQ